MTLKTVDITAPNETVNMAAAGQQAVVYGRPMRDQFLLDPAFHNLNQGMYCTRPGIKPSRMTC